MFRIGPAGAVCFQGESDEIPRLTAIEAREDNFRMDLVCYQPAPFENIARLIQEAGIRPRMLWEIPIPSSPEESGSSVNNAKNSFNRSWIDFLEDKGYYTKMKKAGMSLYKTDYVACGERYMLPVRCVELMRKTSVFERQFLPFQKQVDQERREGIFRAIAEQFRLASPGFDPDGLEFIAEVTQSALFRSFCIEGKGFKTFHFIKAFVAQNQALSDAECVFLFGASYIERNIEIVVDCLRALSRKAGADDMGAPKNEANRKALPVELIWLRPQLPGWGRTEKFFEGLEKLKSAARHHGRLKLSCKLVENRATTVKRGFEPVQLRNYDEHFDSLMTLRSDRIPPRIEVILVKGCGVMVISHSVIVSQGGSILPVGFYSESEVILERLEKMIEESNPRKLPERN
jgi:hypothetical protein